MLLGSLICGNLATHRCFTDTWETHLQVFFHPADRLIDLTLSVQPHAGRAAGMHPVQPEPVPDTCLVLCSCCRTGMGGRKEWGSRRWPLIPLHGCCGACKDGFVLKNHSPMYTGAGGGELWEGPQCLREVLTPFSHCLSSSKTKEFALIFHNLLYFPTLREVHMSSLDIHGC